MILSQYERLLKMFKQHRNHFFLACWALRQFMMFSLFNLARRWVPKAFFVTFKAFLVSFKLPALRNSMTLFSQPDTPATWAMTCLTNFVLLPILALVETGLGLLAWSLVVLCPLFLPIAMLVGWLLAIEYNIQLQKWEYKQYPINCIIGSLLQMDNPSQQQKQPSSQNPPQTIQKILNHDATQVVQINRRSCDRCGVKENQIRDFNKIIIINFEETNELYCDECLELVLIEEQIDVRKLQQKYIYQKQFETSISESDIKNSQFSEVDPDALNLQQEVEALEQNQNQIDYLLTKAKNDCQQLQEKVFNLQQKQQKFWSDMNKFQKRALKLQQKSFIAKNQGQIEKKSLECLSKTSIIHIFFNIQIEDSYAQVYGLTIGKKPEQLEVNWQQTNAGIGHLLLAYNYLILKYGLSYTRIQNMRIKGHLSEIQLRNSQNYYPVGYGISTSSVFSADKIFGVIMECLLAEMSDLAQHIQEIQNIQYSQQLKLPFVIEKKEGRIYDLYVNPTKLDQKTKWNQWTKAMRYFLINFKHILTIASLSDPYL